jgi:iron complex outermembrane receptor protein
MKVRNKALTGLAGSVSGLALLVSAPAWAQETTTGPVIAADGTCAVDAEGSPIAGDPDCADVTTGAAASSSQGGAIVVTGSRVKQPSTYNSISPLQVLTAEASRDVGEFDPVQVLQRSPAAAGQQIDATFGGFVLDNGPGSQTLNLRGLGADRTLLLLNGRRLAPAGVEGAPTNPSINLLPGSLIARYDLLLDGASSVYGSDAIAGVGNVILRKDFKGLELYGEGSYNPGGGGNDYTVSAAWGKTFDRGFFGIGAEYAFRDKVTLGDRSFFSDCEEHLEIDQNGDRHSIDLRSDALIRNRNPAIGTPPGACKTVNLTGRIFIEATNYGSVYFNGFNGGQGNTFIPGFTENSLGGRDLDTNGDGLVDVDFQERNADFDPTAVLINQQKVYNVMSYGEYSLGGSMNITPFYEANFSRTEVRNPNAGAFQVFPYVPANNVTNPCNFVSNPNGVDCRRAENMRRAASGIPGAPLSTGFILPVEPIFAIRGDRSNINVDQNQYRGVLGVKGDLPFIAPDWSFEVSGVYSKAKGTSNRRGIREDKLALALGIDPTADFDGDGVFDNDGDGIADDYQELPLGGVFGGPVITPCTGALANPSAAMPDLAQGCVPVNLFAPSVIGTPIGDFATAAERNYVFGDRIFKTTYTQWLVNAYATGNLFKLPDGGDVAMVVGAEYREDKINSRPDLVASNGLLIAFFNDLGAVGKKHVKEAFAELDIPFFLGKPAAEEVRLNVSGRLTDDQFYGTNETYSIKFGWRPIEQVLLKMSYGTSFRAPNLRENFLRGQSGFLTLIDPCAVPQAAFQPGPNGGPNVYQPALETRDSATLANCTREGRDPTRVGIDPQGLNTIGTTSTEISTGGTLDLDAEESTSFTTGAAFADDWGPFSVNLNANYYNIQIRGAIVEPSSQFIINDCFTRQDGIRSPFCDRITASDQAVNRFLISDIQGGFINFNKEQVRGLDFNANFGYDLQVGTRTVELGLNLQANKLIERTTDFIDDTGVLTTDRDQGEFGFPTWTGRATFTAAVDKLTFTWQTRYIGPVEQQEDGIDAFSDAFGFGPDGNRVDADMNGVSDFFSDTCLGMGSRTGTALNGRVAGDNLFCRDVGFAGKYFTHSASLKYTEENWEARIGVSNIFDRAPPRVDGDEVFSVANIPIGNGYDLDGREFFGSVRYKF